MATTNIYLNFNGNCETAFNFYKSVFGNDFTYISRFKDIPTSEDFQVAEENKNRIMHVSLPIGTSVLMGCDVGGDWSPKYTHGNNFSVAITADTKAEAEQIFNALAQDGTIIMPLANTFWGDYFGTLVDQFGINWMMSYNEQTQ